MILAAPRVIAWRENDGVVAKRCRGARRECASSRRRAGVTPTRPEPVARAAWSVRGALRDEAGVRQRDDREGADPLPIEEDLPERIGCQRAQDRMRPATGKQLLYGPWLAQHRWRRHAIKAGQSAEERGACLVDEQMTTRLISCIVQFCSDIDRQIGPRAGVRHRSDQLEQAGSVAEITENVQISVRTESKALWTYQLAGLAAQIVCRVQGPPGTSGGESSSTEAVVEVP